MRFQGTVVRSGRFWAIMIRREPDGVVCSTQSYRWRGRRKAQSTANECVALLYGIPVKSVWVDLTWSD